MDFFDLFKEAYYYLDLLVGFAFPLVFFFLYKTGRMEKFVWHFFWIGVLFGLTWELPIFLSIDSSAPIVTLVRDMDAVAPGPIFLIAHSLWDGGIFVVGIWLVYIICQKPYFQKFRWQEMLVLFIWGQVSAITVEMSSVLNEGWAYISYWWNPVIFRLNDQNITWLIQIVWAAATIAYYLLLIKLKPKYN